MFFLIAFICCIGFLGVQATGIACPAGWTEFDSFCYRVDGKAVTWSEAQSYCMELGGELAKITSARENDFVLALARKHAPSVKQVWIGLKWYPGGNFFVWTDHSLPSYSNWAPKEPNGSGKEQCGLMFLRRDDPLPYTGSGYWNDLGCTETDPLWNCGTVCKRLP